MSDLTVKEIVITQPEIFRGRCSENGDWVTKLCIPGSNIDSVRKFHGVMIVLTLINASSFSAPMAMYVLTFSMGIGFEKEPGIVAWIKTDSDNVLAERLKDRIGSYHLSQRVLREKDTYRDPFRHRDIEELIPVAGFLQNLLKLLCLWERGVRNTLDFTVTENVVRIKQLPEPFSGFRILQLSDLHFDSNTEWLPELVKRLQGLEYDLCVLTGDYSPGYADSAELKSAMQQIRDAVSTDIVSVLGNHDSIFMVPWLEDMGVRVLLNESITLERMGEKIVIAGVDDYHRFRLSNLEKAMGETGGEVVVLLNHSPEQYRQAAYAGVDLYLAGHTHGGQICLPNGFAPKLNIECGRKVGSGRWQFKKMSGYTSRGIGTSLVNVRFNCPPELVIHELSQA